MKLRTLLMFIVVLLVLPAYSQEITYTTKNDLSYLLTNVVDSYKQERCKLDICYPTNKKGFATVVWFHGGSLKGGKKYFPKELLN